MRHAAEWWVSRVAEVEAAGDLEGVARRHGVKAGTLKWWRTQLRKRARTSARPSPRLLPVVMKDAAATPALAHDPLEVFVEVGTTRMTLRGGVSAEHLAAIVTAAARSC